VGDQRYYREPGKECCQLSQLDIMYNRHAATRDILANRSDEGCFFCLVYLPAELRIRSLQSSPFAEVENEIPLLRLGQSGKKPFTRQRYRES
jgi:hypothetical protein